jgi:hypothetical protein
MFLTYSVDRRTPLPFPLPRVGGLAAEIRAPETDRDFAVVIDPDAGDQAGDEGAALARGRFPEPLRQAPEGTHPSKSVRTPALTSSRRNRWATSAGLRRISARHSEVVLLHE